MAREATFVDLEEPERILREAVPLIEEDVPDACAAELPGAEVTDGLGA